MKTKDKSTNDKKDKNKKGHENQNIHDFNPSQFVEDNDVDKIKEKSKSGRITQGENKE